MSVTAEGHVLVPTSRGIFVVYERSAPGSGANETVMEAVVLSAVCSGIVLMGLALSCAARQRRLRAARAAAALEEQEQLLLGGEEGLGPSLAASAGSYAELSEQSSSLGQHLVQPEPEARLQRAPALTPKSSSGRVYSLNALAS